MRVWYSGETERLAKEGCTVTAVCARNFELAERDLETKSRVLPSASAPGALYCLLILWCALTGPTSTPSKPTRSIILSRSS